MGRLLRAWVLQKSNERRAEGRRGWWCGGFVNLTIVYGCCYQTKPNVFRMSLLKSDQKLQKLWSIALVIEGTQDWRMSPSFNLKSLSVFEQLLISAGHTFKISIYFTCNYFQDLLKNRTLRSFYALLQFIQWLMKVLFTKQIQWNLHVYT